MIGALLAIFVLEIARNLVLPQMAVALPWLPIGVDFGMFLLIYLAMLVAGLVIGLLGSAVCNEPLFEGLKKAEMFKDRRHVSERFQENH